MDEAQSRAVGNDHFCDPMPEKGVALFESGLWNFGVDDGVGVAYFHSGSVCPFCKTDLIGVIPE